ncbi:hypothetical protein FS837_006816 [Tulasnella sp. UAMH 9824]|nr:hypothetical protein FS837_006816 [Tulasnella sp. UAMH 9824]
MFNCVINPIHQFTQARGLPSRPLLQDSHNMKTFGNISAFMVVDVVPATQYDLSQSSPFPQGMADAIFGGFWAGVWDPITGKEIYSCERYLGYNYINNDEDIQIELQLVCGPTWDGIEFRTSAKTPYSRPYVYMAWNSSVYHTRPVLNAGLSSSYFDRPDTTEFSSVITGLAYNPNEVEPGVTFNLTLGQDLNIGVGRRRDYNVRGTFLDLIGGFSQPPSVYVTYPILSVTDSPDTTEEEITSLNFYPMFSGYNDELYEQYLDQTVLTGLSKTGGLYSSFEVVFVLFFGRSLLAALFGKQLAHRTENTALTLRDLKGKNNTNPFGRIANTIQGDKFRRRLQEAYPGIDGEDPKQRVEATCAFLHDFILDLKPLNIKPTYVTRRPTRNDTEDASAGSNVIGGEKDIEAAQVTPSLRLQYDSEAAHGSEKV